MDLLPPYLNKLIKNSEKELNKAKKMELKAKSNLQFCTEYTKLCENQLLSVKTSQEKKKEV